LFKKHLLATINDPRSYELPTILISDDNLYPILDSAILSLEKCVYFDERVKYIYAFSLSSKEDSEGMKIYSLFGLHSVEFVVGLDFNRSIGIDKPSDVGVFYYKNYLFAVPLVDSKGKEINFPFCKKTDCQSRVKAYSLYKEKVYDSSFDFVLKYDKYKVVEDHICGAQILVKH